MDRVETGTPRPLRAEALPVSWMPSVEAASSIYSLDQIFVNPVAGMASPDTQMRVSSKSEANASESQHWQAYNGSAVESLLNQRAAVSPKHHDDSEQSLVRTVRLCRGWVIHRLAVQLKGEYA